MKMIRRFQRERSALMNNKKEDSSNSSNKIQSSFEDLNLELDNCFNCLNCSIAFLQHHFMLSHSLSKFYIAGVRVSHQSIKRGKMRNEMTRNTKIKNDLYLNTKHSSAVDRKVSPAFLSLKTFQWKVFFIETGKSRSKKLKHTGNS